MTDYSDGYPPGCTQADHDRAFSDLGPEDREYEEDREAELRLDRELLERAEREMDRAEDRRERRNDKEWSI